MTEERHQAVGCGQQVDRVPRGRRVDHDQVVLAAGPQLVQALDGHVLLRSRERAGDAAVDGVRQDGLHPLLVAGTIGDHAIEGGLGIEHLRPQRAGGMRGGADHLHRVVRASGGIDAQRVGKTPSGVDGDHDDPATGSRSGQRQRGCVLIARLVAA